MARLRVAGRAEAQRVEVGDGARAHGKDVAHDAADAGRRALVWLDVGGVVVAFHLENDGLPVADIRDAGVLAGALDDLRALRGQLLQPDAGGFVGAMLGPHHRDNAKLSQVRRAAQLFAGEPEFGPRHAVRRRHVFGCDGHSARHVYSLSVEILIEGTTPHPVLPSKLALASLQPRASAFASECGWGRRNP